MNTQGKAVKEAQRPVAGSMPGTSEREQATECTEEESGGGRNSGGAGVLTMEALTGQARLRIPF